MKRLLLLLFLLPSLAFAQKPPINGVAGPTTSTQLQSILTDGANNLQVQSTGSTTPRTLATRFAEAVNVQDFGAVANGSTDNTTAIAAAIAAAAPSCKAVYFPSAAFSYALASSITLAPCVTLYGLGNAILEWTGSTTPMFTSSATTTLNQSGLINFKIIAATASKVFELKSPFKSIFRDLWITSNSATSTIVDVGVNAAGSTNPVGTRNAVLNQFQNIYQSGTAGTFVKLEGDGTQFVTLNTFDSIDAEGISVYGLNFSKWADTNTFIGTTRVRLIANNAIGAIYNSADPTNNVGVYANNFTYLAVDTFATLSGRVGIKINNAKEIEIAYLYQFPVAEGGSIVATSDAVSYRVFGVAEGNDTFLAEYSKLKHFANNVTFTGTTIAGLVANSLTTTQKNALSGANGMLLYDSTLSRLSAYNGSWNTLPFLEANNNFATAQTISNTGAAISTSYTDLTFINAGGYQLGTRHLQTWFGSGGQAVGSFGMTFDGSTNTRFVMRDLYSGSTGSTEVFGFSANGIMSFGGIANTNAGLRGNGTTVEAVLGDGSTLSPFGATNITGTGTVRANTAFSANGAAGLSATKTVRDAAGTGTCTLEFTFGLLTGGSC